MAAAAVESPLPVTIGAGCNENAAPATHPRTADIIRQVEFYFSDDNLSQDAHLLGLFKEGNGSVSFNEICGFKKMRQFKPRSAVREALRLSTLVEVSDDGKRLKRKYALDRNKITVIPKINEDRKKVVIPEDKPWLTKAMLKPTGFESYVTDGPIKPEEYEEDRKEYDLDNVFTSRVETAITRFCAKRKMHENTRNIFSKFMVFGGMDCNQRQFIGGLDEKAMEDYTKKEMAEMTAYYGVSERVLDGLYEDGADGVVTWNVDFEAVAKAFLSSEFLNSFDWYDEDQVKAATNVLRNFYNYLLLHEVCPEYKDQLMAARKVCDYVEEELPKLKEVDRHLPGGFNCACSTLFEGNYANLHASGGDWVMEGDDMGWSKKDADLVFKVAIFAHGNESLRLEVEKGVAKGTSFKVKSSEELGLEIVGMDLADGQAMEIYTSPELVNTIVRPMGKLYCKRWEVPHAAPMDLPKYVREQQKAQEFEFLVDEETLKYCVPGMKMECCVKELDLGIKWIDYVETTYPSFYTWLPNERIREWKEPGPPKAWMLRQMGVEPGEGEDAELEWKEAGYAEL